MATKTEKYGLIKPDENDYYDIGVFNENMEILDSEAATMKEYTITVGTVWTGEEAPFTQTIAVEGILATDEPIVDISLSDDYDTMIAQLEDYAKIIKLVTAENSVTVYFNDTTLEVLTLRLKVIC